MDKVNLHCRFALIGAVLLGLPMEARAFSPEITKSVVALLPDWSTAPTQQARLEEPEGTAVAVLPGGYLATNVHVLASAKTASIRLEGGRVLPVEIVGRDVATDIALIKAPIEFPVPEIGPEPALGSPVCAVGNQFGLGLSVTCGVVSALSRAATGFNAIEDFIQTDAVVNPGGSGGALVDRDSRLVGLISAIFTKRNDANIGVNFAASTRLLYRVVNDLKAFGRVRRVNPGLAVGTLSQEQLEKHSGVSVVRVSPSGPAAIAGLQIGDVIAAVGGRTVRTPPEFIREFHMFRPNESASVSFFRGDSRKTISLKLEP